LKLARDGTDDESEWIFSARGPRGHLVQFFNDGLPAAGNSLRHAYRTEALAAGVDELSTRLLMGHSLRGVSQGYIARAALTGFPSLRAAQRAISRRIVALLNPAVRAPALAPDGPQDSEVTRGRIGMSMPPLVYLDTSMVLSDPRQ
jgi:hypothetical protein